MFAYKVSLTLFSYVVFTNASFVINDSEIRAYPCVDTEAVLETYSPKDSEKSYDIFIPVNTIFPDGLPSNSSMFIQFDSSTNLRLNKNFGRVFPDKNGKFLIKFHTAVDDNLSLKIKGRKGEPIPNLLSLVINGDELCPRGTKTGIWDAYITENVTVSSSVPECGRRKTEHTALITNAEDTKPGDWPWHAAIYRTVGRTQRYICGGTLLTKSRVLTAGHCVVQSGKKVIPERLLAVLGKYNLAGGDVASQEVGVHEIDLHENFDPTSLKNDIAMLVLLSDVSYGDYVQPICLWDVSSGQTAAFYGTSGYVVGWRFDEGNLLSNTLAQAVIPIVPDLTCLRSNLPFFLKYLTENTYCAGLSNGTSVCNGDDGGGMYLPEEDHTGRMTWHLRGIVSLSAPRKDPGLCGPNHYTIFTDVTKYIKWIQDRL